MDDILRQLGVIEAPVADIGAHFTAQLPTRMDLRSMEARLIKWIVGSQIVSTALASIIAAVITKAAG